MEEKQESEFGKGLVICLVKFAEHQARWQEQKKFYQDINKKHPEHFRESDAVEIHMNGASDHLYEIEVPEAWKGTEIDSKVTELQDLGLAMGHGFRQKKVWTEADVLGAYELAEEIALLIDKKLGLDAQKGQW